MIALGIAILKVTLNVSWRPLILSAVGWLENLISTWRPDLELNPGPLRWKRACYRSATVARRPPWLGTHTNVTLPSFVRPFLNVLILLNVAHLSVMQAKLNFVSESYETTLCCDSSVLFISNKVNFIKFFAIVYNLYYFRINNILTPSFAGWSRL